MTGDAPGEDRRLAGGLVSAGRHPDELPRRAAVQGDRPPGARAAGTWARPTSTGSWDGGTRSRSACSTSPRAPCPVALFGPQVRSVALFPVYCGIAAVVGHVFSVFVGFKGGKGVATAAGVVLGLAPWALLAVALVWAVLVRADRLRVARQHRGRRALSGRRGAAAPGPGGAALGGCAHRGSSSSGSTGATSSAWRTAPRTGLEPAAAWRRRA